MSAAGIGTARDAVLEPTRSSRSRARVGEGRAPAPRRTSPKIAFLVRALEYGGAERQLVVLAKALHERGNDVRVLTFYAGAPLEAELRQAGVPLRSLGKTGRWDVFGFLRRLHGVLREERVDILHGYLDVPNAVAVVMRVLHPGLTVVWGVRASYMDLTQFDWLARVTSPIVRALSRYAHLVIANSRAGLEYAVAHGYRRATATVIPNGIDAERFVPDRAPGLRVRAEWGVAPHECLIGLIGRLDPMKDHATFLAAASRLGARPDVRFVCVGGGEPRYAGELAERAEQLELADRLIWAGPRPDMCAVYNALDIMCSSSSGEGFPNVIGEAMACGVPCVVTDVGDSAWILDQPALVAPPRDPAALAERMRRLVDDRAYAARVGADGRQRILREFSVSRLAASTEAALSQLIAGRLQ